MSGPTTINTQAQLEAGVDEIVAEQIAGAAERAKSRDRVLKGEARQHLEANTRAAFTTAYAYMEYQWRSHLHRSGVVGEDAVREAWEWATAAADEYDGLRQARGLPEVRNDDLEKLIQGNDLWSRWNQE